MPPVLQFKAPFVPLFKAPFVPAMSPECCCATETGPCYDKTHHAPHGGIVTISGTYSHLAPTYTPCPNPSVFDGAWVVDAATNDCFTCGMFESFPLVGCCNDVSSGFSGNFDIDVGLSGAAPSNSHPMHLHDCFSPGTDAWTYATTTNLYWYIKLTFTCPANPPGTPNPHLKVCSSFKSSAIAYDSMTGKYPIIGTFTLTKQTTRDAGYNLSNLSQTVCNEFAWDTIWDTGADNVITPVNFPSSITLQTYI